MKKSLGCVSTIILQVILVSSFFFSFFEAAVFLHTRTPIAVFIPTAWSLENVLLFLVSFIVWHLLSSASSMSHLHLLKSPSFSPSSVTSCFFPPSNKVNCHVSAQSTREQREAFGGLFDSALSLSFIFFTNHRHPHKHFFPCLPSLTLHIIRTIPVIHWYFPKSKTDAGAVSPHESHWWALALSFSFISVTLTHLSFSSCLFQEFPENPTSPGVTPNHAPR